MLHQIRKLIGTMLAVVRGEISENDQKFALLTHQFAPTPMAPELGLFLCECVYGAYNNRFGSVHEKFELAKHGDKSEAFKRKHVYTHIARQEREENTMRNWIRDVLQGERSLRNQFDAGMAASIAAEEQLDPTRVGQRSKKRPAPESDVSRNVRDSFNTAMSEAAERAKAKKLKSSFNDRNLERADAGQVATQKRMTETPQVEVKSHIPSDELSE
jgi:tRNA pseudouridine38-40 synthase